MKLLMLTLSILLLLTGSTHAQYSLAANNDAIPHLTEPSFTNSLPQTFHEKKHRKVCVVTRVGVATMAAGAIVFFNGKSRLNNGVHSVEEAKGDLIVYFTGMGIFCAGAAMTAGGVIYDVARASQRSRFGLVMPEGRTIGVAYRF